MGILFTIFEAMKSSGSFTVNIIKSLSPPEKAYVKKQISSGNKHLLQLFNDLNKCDYYQKSTFIKRNSNKRYITNLSQNKNYLGRKIIDALINYRAKSSIDIEVFTLINEIHILVDKKFYKRAKKLIDRALQNVILIENYHIGYTLIEVIFRILSNQVHFRLSKEEINLYKEKRKFFLQQLNRMETIDLLNDVFRKYNKSNFIEQPSLLLDAYKEKLKQLSLLDKNDLHEDYPFKAKRAFYFAKVRISRLLNQPDNYIHFSKKVISLYEKNEHFLKYHCVLFLGDCVNYLDNLLKKGDYSKIIIEQQRINQLIKKNKKDSLSTNNNILDIINYFFPQLAYNHNKNFDKALQFSNDYISYLKNSDGLLSDHFIAASSIQIAYANLYSHNYAKALEYVDPALNFKNYETQYQARMLQILAHHLADDDLLMDHLFRSFFNYLKTVDKKDKIKNIRKFRDHIKNKTIYLLKNEDFEEFVYIHWDEFEEK